MTQLRKQANLLELIQQIDPVSAAHFAGSWIAGDATLNFLRRKGLQRSPEMFDTAYRLGREGKQVNLHTQNLIHSVLGKETVKPLHEGRMLGDYIRRHNFTTEQEQAYLKHLRNAALDGDRMDFIEGMANHDLKHFGKEHSQYGDDLDHYLKNDVQKDSLVHRAVGLKPDAVDKKPGLAHLVQDVGFASAAPLTDFRLATRPAFRRIDKTPIGKRLNQSIEGESKFKKALQGTKDYIS